MSRAPGGAVLALAQNLRFVRRKQRNEALVNDAAVLLLALGFAHVTLALSEAFFAQPQAMADAVCLTISAT